MSKWSKIPWKTVIILAVVALLLGAAGVLFFSRGCGDQPRPSTSDKIPPGWQGVATQKTPYIGRNEASEYTAGFPAGSKVVVLRPPKNELAKVAILPGGKIAVPEGTEATIYEKRPPIIKGEIRPWLGGGVVGNQEDIAPAVAAGVDVVRLWRLHGGLGVAANKDSVTGLAAVGVKAWRNVDARVAGGYGTGGAAGFVGVSIGIE